VELIPYFFAMLAWVGLAVGGIILAPLAALLRRLRRARRAPEAEVQSPPTTTPGPESPGEGSHDRD
jgi:hypothetical protein